MRKGTRRLGSADRQLSLRIPVGHIEFSGDISDSDPFDRRLKFADRRCIYWQLTGKRSGCIERFFEGEHFFGQLPGVNFVFAGDDSVMQVDDPGGINLGELFDCGFQHL